AESYVMMNRLVISIGALILLLPFAACGEQIVADRPPMPEPTFEMDPAGIEISDFATGLEVVWEMRFTPDGRMLVTERAGRIRVIDADGKLREQPWAAPDRVFHSGGGGMMGLALHPDYPATPLVYAMYTEDRASGPVNRVVRFRDTGSRGVDMEVVLDDLPAANTHNGGRIAFGPDGMLYVTIGDTGRAETAQDVEDLRGSILRVTADGEVPDDNPWSGSPVFAIGLRNAQGLAFHPHTGELFAADHGPSHHDQLHIVQAGGNHGWPEVLGAAGLPDYIDPIAEWVPAAPPGSLLFYTHERIPELNGELLLTSLRAEALIRIGFDDPDRPARVDQLARWFVDRNLGTSSYGEGPSRFGRVRALALGPDGALYIGTSNRDRGRGTIREGDDRIVRIVPR
ncbi:MAG: PQQ-dependent sugar dehydrogenase, partial [Wenzhouxiangellaceae bacterium]